MSLAEQLAALIPPEVPKCHACRLLLSLTGDDLAAFAAAVDSTASAEAISKAMRENDHVCPERQIRVHRNEKHQP